MDVDLMEFVSASLTLSDHTAFVLDSLALLSRLVCADDVSWMETDLTTASSTVWHSQDPRPGIALGQLLSNATTHPTVRSYAERPEDWSPRRLSDLVSDRQWLDLAGITLQGAVGIHQLSILVSRRSANDGVACLLSRDGSDFSDDDIAQVRLVQPVLRVLDEHLRPPERPASLTTLTARETEVITKLATGATAAAIGHELGISVRTVDKHLENAYVKLGARDRLLAVDRARRLGLIG